jgi:hypothetical protein
MASVLGVTSASQVVALGGSMTGTRAVIVHLGRTRGMGEALRVRSWRAVLATAGVDAVPVQLRADHGGRPSIGQAVNVVRGTAVPESLAWSAASVRRTLDDLAPDLVVCVTARAYQPGVVDNGAMTVLDYVDRLSVSYGDRARILGTGARQVLFRTLAAANGAFERRSVPEGVRAVAAGWADASTLGVPWVPIVLEPEPVLDRTAADSDVLFVGNLSYPPNVAAVLRLSRMWPEVLRRRRGTTAILAGARPTAQVSSAAAACGWELIPDFPDLDAVCARVRMAVVPLDHASGIQCKVLEAASKGLPQVITPAAAAGLDPHFPLTVAATDESFVQAVVDMLNDPAVAASAGTRARAHMDAHYRPAAWSGWARDVLPALPAVPQPARPHSR